MDLTFEKRALFFVRTTRKSRKEKVRLEKMRTQEGTLNQLLLNAYCVRMGVKSGVGTQ